VLEAAWEPNVSFYKTMLRQRCTLLDLSELELAGLYSFKAAVVASRSRVLCVVRRERETKLKIKHEVCYWFLPRGMVVGAPRKL
jgi:hypothetical protein